MDGHVQERMAGPRCSTDLQMTLYLAESLLRTGQGALAIDHYRWAGAQLTARGEIENALAVYGVLAQLLPHCMHTQGMLAELHRRRGRVDDAARIYERIAETHFAQGRILEAAHVYRLVLEIDPTTVPRRVRLAELYVLLGQSALAVPLLEVAAGQLLAGERFAEYVVVADRLLALRPGDPRVLRGLVGAHLHLRALRSAVARLQQLFGVRPRDDAGRELLADCLLAHGRPDRAARALRLLADEVRRRGVHAYDEAKRLLVRAVRVHPYDRPAHVALRSLEAEIAAVAERDFTEHQVTGVIEEISSAEIIVEHASPGVIAMRRRGVPEALPSPSPSPSQAGSPPQGQVIYARFG